MKKWEIIHQLQSLGIPYRAYDTTLDLETTDVALDLKQQHSIIINAVTDETTLAQLAATRWLVVGRFACIQYR